MWGCTQCPSNANLFCAFAHSNQHNIANSHSSCHERSQTYNPYQHGNTNSQVIEHIKLLLDIHIHYGILIIGRYLMYFLQRLNYFILNDPHFYSRFGSCCQKVNDVSLVESLLHRRKRQHNGFFRTPANTGVGCFACHTNYCEIDAVYLHLFPHRIFTLIKKYLVNTSS